MKKDIKTKGFTLVEMLMSLFVFSMSMSILVSSLPILSKIQKNHIEIEEEIAFKQLRNLLAIASEIKFSEEELDFYYLQKQCSLIIDHNRVYRTDGYVIYLENIKNARFLKKGSCIYLNYERNERNKERFLACES